MGITHTAPLHSATSTKSVDEHQMKAQRFHARHGGKRKGVGSLTQNLAVAELKLATYSVTFESKELLGLELSPENEKKKTGALVTRCLNKFSNDNVLKGSRVVGVQDELVMALDHDEIIEIIEGSSAPLRLTFCWPSFFNEGRVDSESMSTWRGHDGKKRFECR